MVTGFGLGRGCFGREGVQSCTGSFPEMVDAKPCKGPIRFGLAMGNAAVNVNGFSNHFPVSVMIKEGSAP
jgi:hypothetical protein